MLARDFVAALDLPAESSRRYDCPECGGHKTLSVTNSRGSLRWQCFRASCSVAGVTSRTRTADEIRQELAESRFDVGDDELPELSYPWRPAKVSEEVVRYLQDNRVQWALDNNLVDVKYDPIRHRAAFLIKRNGKVVDAAGRALRQGDKPKWYRYASTGLPFVCGTSRLAVVVEDAASACAVASLATGVALLGTSVSAVQLGELRNFDRVAVCLDKDASRKALELHRYLSYFCACEMVPLEDDLKYLDPDEIRAVLKSFL